LPYTKFASVEAFQEAVMLLMFLLDPLVMYKPMD